MTLKYGIHWFRQDLRLENNPSLIYLSNKVEHIIPIFIFDPKTRNGSASNWWLEKSLISLSKSISLQKGKLNIFKGNPEEVFSIITKNKNIKHISWNRLYDPYSIDRDKKIKKLLFSKNVNCMTHNGYLLNEPWNIKNKGGTFFKVFTPYWHHCNEIMKDKKFIKSNSKYDFSENEFSKEKNISQLNLTNKKMKWLKKFENNWLPGENNAQLKLKEYILNKVNDYSIGRDRPDKDLTSKLSPYLHFGEISPTQIYYDILKLKIINKESQKKFLSELGWRDFSYNLLYHYPGMIKNPIQEKFNKFPWLNDSRNFKIWQKGMTGIPIVDAGMRQLYKSGWMHNRVRMIVGSFLTKNLLLHWKKGEEWFFDTLVDADIGSNTAGWQWISGCGADASPFFRIFNPILQGQKFDPEGEYVKTYVPELINVSNKYIHNPWEMSYEDQKNFGCTIGKDYPLPIVNLKETRDRALLAFKSLN